MKPLIGIVILLVVAAMVGTLVGRSTAPATQPQIDRQQDVAVGFEQIVPEITFDKTPLDKAIDSLRDRTHANIIVNWNALEAGGVDRDTPITLRLTKLPLRRVLDVIGIEAGGGGTVKLTAVADDGVITFSTDEDNSKSVESHIYDVRDLILADRAFLSLGATTQASTQQYAGQQQQTLFSGPTTNAATPPSESVDRLIRLICDQISADSWRDAGGTTGSIQEFDGMLIVVQTPQNQRLIALLLERLRKRSGPS